MASGMSAGFVMDLLRRQMYRCSLSGRVLTPETMTLDHIIPLAKGGKYCCSNVQLVHSDVNTAKGTMSNEDFKQMCMDVVMHLQATAKLA